METAYQSDIGQQRSENQDRVDSFATDAGMQLDFENLIKRLAEQFFYLQVGFIIGQENGGGAVTEKRTVKFRIRQ